MDVFLVGSEIIVIIIIMRFSYIFPFFFGHRVVMLKELDFSGVGFF